jgi:hypothetical protein
MTVTTGGAATSGQAVLFLFLSLAKRLGRRIPLSGHFLIVGAKMIFDQAASRAIAMSALGH